MTSKGPPFGQKIILLLLNLNFTCSKLGQHGQNYSSQSAVFEVYGQPKIKKVRRKSFLGFRMPTSMNKIVEVLGEAVKLIEFYNLDKGISWYLDPSFDLGP